MVWKNSKPILKKNIHTQTYAHKHLTINSSAKIKQVGPYIVGHTYNPSYSRGRDGGITVQGQPGQKVPEDSPHHLNKQVRCGGA
jgi:hypothetical protein